MLRFTKFLAFLLSTRFCEALPPVTGPILPRPSNLQSSTDFKYATQNITGLLDRAVVDNSSLANVLHNLSLSVAITSYAAPEDNPVLWEYHHLATQHNENGTNHLSGSSQYLIASITKVFTDLLILKSGVDLTASVTRYLPELRSSRNDIAWQNITILDLMSHLSGIPQNFGFPEIYQLIPIYQQLGFPAVPESDFPPCGVIGLNSGCNSSQLLKGMISSSQHAVFEPGLSPAYNNIAFAILGIILERQTNQTFGSLIQTQIAEPLHMHSTGLSPGNTSAAVIPSGDSSWGSDFGINAPQGGVFSTTDDLSRFARAILASSPHILDSKSRIDKWLKPRALLSGTDQAIGTPWEIYRTDRILPNQTIDIYVKDGGVVGYSSRLALFPQFGVGITCLTAGPVGGPDLVMETVMSILVPALNTAVAREADKSYTGTWHNISSDIAANMTTIVDEDGLGLRISGLFRNGSDILAAIETIYEAGPVVAGQLSTDWRAYYTGLTYDDVITGSDQVQVDVTMEDWRLGFETTRFQLDKGSELEMHNKGIFQNSVSSWFGLDSMYYGGQAIDRIVMIKSRSNGDVIGIRVPSLRVDLWKD